MEEQYTPPPDIQSSRTGRQMYQQTDRQSGARVKKLHPLFGATEGGQDRLVTLHVLRGITAL